MATAATVCARLLIGGWQRFVGQRTRTVVVDTLRTRMRALSDPYRPELYYMRGPGPKWREKHGRAGHLGR